MTTINTTGVLKPPDIILKYPPSKKILATCLFYYVYAINDTLNFNAHNPLLF